MIDTGFNENLTLPAWVIERLKLPLGHQGTYMFGDGGQSQANVYRGEIEWHGSWRKIAIVEIEHDALLGTATIMGSNLNIDMVDGGRVEIRPLQSQASSN